jgi:hypothetical protein
MRRISEKARRLDRQNEAAFLDTLWSDLEKVMMRFEEVIPEIQASSPRKTSIALSTRPPWQEN